ncbi:hypothetical protein PsorP6_009962 [Peronosclerospora sorghi]|uniref:Uncharacterized protein n=1 Tax=Peronosclerospora sorghi TaxID=230839 RepID=A0ACC0VW66_9STRA|nr:hypothetical protein PsorP6_009962 [Peronosclerospora sorghi]
MDDAKPQWSDMMAPARGEIVRQIGEELRSKQARRFGQDSFPRNGQNLFGVLPSERPGHFMMERYNPRMGHVGLVTAFNFPCAVLFWNAALSLGWRFKSPLSRFRFHPWRAPRLLLTCWILTVNIFV